MKQNTFLSVVRAVCMAVLVVVATSCDKIYEDLEPCPRGVNLRFVYDYNMEYANSFHKKVDCITLFIYDANGNYLETRTETTDVLADENYRMTIDLKEGNYRFVAYGGMACEESSFTMTPPEAGMSSVQVEMNHDNLTSDEKLHDLYFGTLDVTIDREMYQDMTLYMMKDTNNIRIVLQQLLGNVDVNDFTAYITDDNTLFAYDNSLLDNGTVTYNPWTSGSAIAGATTEGDEEVVVGYFEFSTSRLMTTRSPRLVIKRNDLGTDIVNIPLINYLLLLKSQLYANMESQEFLDRESEWSMVFFLDTKHAWINTQVIINDWIVRLNDGEI